MSDYIRSSNIKKSKKKYYCDFCGCEIPKGSSYLYEVVIFDGELCCNHLHHECNEIYKSNYKDWFRDEDTINQELFYDCVDDNLEQRGIVVHPTRYSIYEKVCLLLDYDGRSISNDNN